MLGPPAPDGFSEPILRPVTNSQGRSLGWLCEDAKAGTDSFHPDDRRARYGGGARHKPLAPGENTRSNTAYTASFGALSLGARARALQARVRGTRAVPFCGWSRQLYHEATERFHAHEKWQVARRNRNAT